MAAALSRRSVLAGLGTTLLAGGSQGLVSLDWGISETLYAMGLPVAGAASAASYDRVVIDPPTPPATRDVGLWSAPNLELLQALDPGLILIPAWQRGLMPVLRTIGPVEAVAIYTRQGSAYAAASAATRQIAGRAGAAAAGAALVEGTEAAFQQGRDALRGHDGRPVAVLKIVDGRTLIVFSRTGLFHDVLERLGLRNAWTGAPDLLCGASRIGLADLAAFGDAHVVIVDTPGQARPQALYDSALWAAMPFVAAGRVSRIASLWEFGALPTAQRFAGLITAALAA
jgi:ABC-type Fe3+-hydroxamate transport system substrate-binding protein